MSSKALITIELNQSYPPETWEKIEDAIAEALAQLSLDGEITNSVTLNSTQIRKDTNDRRS